MPVPFAAIFWALVEAALIGTTAYEAGELAETLYDTLDEYELNRKGAKEFARQRLEEIKETIRENIDEKTELAFLIALTEADLKEQREVTKKAQGRGADKDSKGNSKGNNLIEAAIKQRIPFRRVISAVCAQADKTPIISLRKKKDAKIELKDLPKAKKKALEAIARMGVEQIADIPDAENFILVQMKQLVVNLIFEFLDEMLDWKSPLKAEVCFGPQFADPIIGTPSPRLYRSKDLISNINPFYPLPYRNKGSLSADLAIPDYRANPIKKDNLFAIIEIKFQNDRIDEEQFKKYDDLNDACGKQKTATVGVARTHNENGVTKGFRLALYRFPEDTAVEKGKDEEAKKEDEKTQKKTTKQNKRGK